MSVSFLQAWQAAESAASVALGLSVSDRPIVPDHMPATRIDGAVSVGMTHAVNPEGPTRWNAGVGGIMSEVEITWFRLRKPDTQITTAHQIQTDHDKLVAAFMDRSHDWSQPYAYHFERAETIDSPSREFIRGKQTYTVTFYVTIEVQP